MFLISSEKDNLLVDFLQTFGLFLGMVSKTDVFPCSTPQKVDEIHRAIYLTYSCISSVQIYLEISYFVFG